MRVLHVTPYFAPAFVYGGPPRSILGLCRALAASGVDVEVLTTTADRPSDLPPATDPGHRYDGVPVRYFSRAFPRRLFRARGLDRAIADALTGCDLLHVHGLWNIPAWQAAALARRRHVPYVISPRGMLDRAALRRRALAKRLGLSVIERRNLARAALIHAASELEADAIECQRLGVPIAVVPNGTEPLPREVPGGPEIRRRLGLPAHARLVVYLGRIHPGKRLDLLARAFDRIRAVRSDVDLVIAGPDERGHRRAIEPAFAAAASRVHWTGALGDAERWALLADAFALVMCSDSESFGMSVAEAMAAALPVVVTRTCPWPEVEERGSGLWVEQRADAIAEGVLALLRDPAAARAMGARGAALVRDRYDWTAVARQMTEHYRAVLARSPLARTAA